MLFAFLFLLELMLRISASGRCGAQSASKHLEAIEDTYFG